MGRDGLTKKLYLELTPPTEADNRSAQVRILQAVEERMAAEIADAERMAVEIADAEPEAAEIADAEPEAAERLAAGAAQVRMSYAVMRALYPLCEDAEWKVTVSLAFDGACPAAAACIKEA